MTLLHDHDPMPFGEFAGRRMDEVPAWYLLDLERRDIVVNAAVSVYTETHRKALEFELLEEQRRFGEDQGVGV